VHELGHRRGADRPDVGRLIADVAQQRFVCPIDDLVAADPDRELPRLGTLGAAADRSVKQVESAPLERLVDASDCRR
jgi:hypothetical protein